MFVVDLIAASILTCVLTVFFAALVRGRGYRGMREFSPTVWVMAVVSWVGGMLLVGFGPALTGTHWLPFAGTVLFISALAFGVAKIPALGGSHQPAADNFDADARPTIALYFVVTLLLFLCAISMRFYIANLA